MSLRMLFRTIYTYIHGNKFLSNHHANILHKKNSFVYDLYAQMLLMHIALDPICQYIVSTSCRILKCRSYSV